MRKRSWRICVYVLFLAAVTDLFWGVVPINADSVKRRPITGQIKNQKESFSNLADGAMTADSSSGNDGLDNLTGTELLIRSALPGVACIGDSLTAGDRHTGVTYPGQLKKLINIRIKKAYPQYSYAYVYNAGDPGEDTITIAGRTGAIPFRITSDLKIPSGIEKTPVHFLSADGREVAPRFDSMVYIGGIYGKLYANHASRRHKESNHYDFSRNTTGKAVTIPSGSAINYAGYDGLKKCIPVIYMGQNGGYNDLEDLVNQINAILKEYGQNIETGKYIVIGMHSGSDKNRQDMEKLMSSVYGSHYINLRYYMVHYGLKDAGIEPDDLDKRQIAEGRTPHSLLKDRVHFTDTGYKLLGTLVYKRMEDLGIFDDLDRVLEKSGSKTEDVKLAPSDEDAQAPDGSEAAQDDSTTERTGRTQKSINESDFLAYLKVNRKETIRLPLEYESYVKMNLKEADRGIYKVKYDESIINVNITKAEKNKVFVHISPLKPGRTKLKIKSEGRRPSGKRYRNKIFIRIEKESDPD